MTILIWCQIDCRVGPASDTLHSLIDEGHGHSFDFIFIDADKARYDEYYELGLKLLRQGGLIAIDNVLWYGKVAAPENSNDKNVKIDKQTRALRALNEKLLYDDRVQHHCLVPIGDGLTLCQKL